MKKQYLIIIGVILLLAGVGAGYYFMNRSPESASQKEGESQVQPLEASTGQMSLKDLLNLGKDQMCTFSYEDENGKVEGTTYISNNRVRSDFKNTVEGQIVDGSMIYDKGYMYTWTNQMKQGMKIAVTEDMAQAAEEAKEDFEKDENQYIDPNEKLDYKCQGWRADQGKFTPPSDITFTDFSEQMKQLQGDAPGAAGTADPSAACGACANIEEEEAAAMCRKTLGCE